MDVLTTILGAVGGSIVAPVAGYFKNKSNHKFELAKMELEGKQREAEANAQIAVANVEQATAMAEIQGKALAAATRAQAKVFDWSKNQKLTAAQLWLPVVVSAVVGITRPVISFGLLGVVAYSAWKTGDIDGLMQQFGPPIAFVMAYWFGARFEEKHAGVAG